MRKCIRQYKMFFQLWLKNFFFILFIYFFCKCFIALNSKCILWSLYFLLINLHFLIFFIYHWISENHTPINGAFILKVQYNIYCWLYIAWFWANSGVLYILLLKISTWSSEYLKVRVRWSCRFWSSRCSSLMCSIVFFVLFLHTQTDL